MSTTIKYKDEAESMQTVEQLESDDENKMNVSNPNQFKKSQFMQNIKKTKKKKKNKTDAAHQGHLKIQDNHDSKVQIMQQTTPTNNLWKNSKIMKRQVLNYNRDKKSQEFDSLASSQVTTIEMKNIELHPVYDDKIESN